MTMNKDIKAKAKKSGVLIWEIADKLGIADTTMSRKLRKELPEAEKERIFNIIDELAADKQASNA